MRSDRERLRDILEAILKIEEYARRGRDEFASSELLQVWMVHHLEIVGEAAGRLSEDLRNSSPHVPWADVIGMRNVLIHEYFGLDLDRIWQTVVEDVPALRVGIEALNSDD